MEYVTQKGFYPFEYTDSLEKLDEPSLPPKEGFYNRLLEAHIKDENYKYAERVWEHFGFKTLGEYSDRYMKVDVMLLCDVFENFRNLSMDTYGVDLNYYYTAPGMAFDCALKITKVELELLPDYNEVIMMEAGTRSGLTQAVKRYTKPTTVMFLAMILRNRNQRYGWAIVQYSSKNGFEWYDKDLSIEIILRLLDGMDDTSPVGLILDVDITYPTSLHDDHNDLPWLPERMVPPGSKINKLVANLNEKTK
ncbi:Ribonuclease H-like domain [Cinara cedri]|uniref:Ribonuclease H-like domain n=1 Tax=Cinara cedri TaxID=506608 RepID=A0A5E4N1W0_9HEMI|nr:Ribonuclease H-like domain [Cinara cedri]